MAVLDNLSINQEVCWRILQPSTLLLSAALWMQGVGGVTHEGAHGIQGAQAAAAGRCNKHSTAGSL